MTPRNVKWLVGGATVGLVAGLAITVPAHQGNPFLNAPGVFLGVVVAGIGSLVTVALLLLFHKRSHTLVGLCACFLTMLAVLVLLPLVWPYPKSDGPKPLTHEMSIDDMQVLGNDGSQLTFTRYYKRRVGRAVRTPNFSVMTYTLPSICTYDGQPLKFTGEERKAETGLDYFGTRYSRGLYSRSNSEPAAT